MAAGGKYKYFLYVALPSRQRRAANFLRVLCISKEGDHLLMQLTAHQTHELNREH